MSILKPFSPINSPLLLRRLGMHRVSLNHGFAKYDMVAASDKYTKSVQDGLQKKINNDLKFHQESINALIDTQRLRPIPMLMERDSIFEPVKTTYSASPFKL